MKQSILLYLFLGLLPGLLCAQLVPEAQLVQKAMAPQESQPADTDFRHGRLPNGLTYYLRHTDFEPGKAEFYLVQNVGALMEEDDQNGLAHFLEHMAFNGSRNFPEGIPAFLKRRGVSPPNAYTGQDETVYYINAVPTADAGLTDSCLLALHDWSGFLTLAPEAIEKERGIILEERRLRRDLQMQLEEQVRPYLYNHTKYADHDVIGSEEVLRNFTREELQRFYHDFYRPDLQAVILVGDIDVRRMEERIRSLFGAIPRRDHPKPRQVYDIPDHDEPLYARVFHPEVPGHAVILMKRIPEKHPESLEEMMRNNLLQLFYGNILQREYRNFLRDNDPDFLQAAINLQPMVRGYGSLYLLARAFPGKDRQALRQLLGLLDRTNRFALTESALQEEIAGYTEELDASEKNGSRYPNSVYVDMYRTAFLENKPFTTVDEDVVLSRRILAELTAEELQQWVDAWYGNGRNWIYILQGNDSTYSFPTAAEISGILQEARGSRPEVLRETTTVPPLIDFEVEPGHILSSRRVPELQAERWTLSNGLTVYYKYNRYEAGKVALFGSGPGGMSQLGAEELPSADALNACMLQSGIYRHDNKTMSAIMKRKQAALRLHLGADSRTVNAFAAGNDVDSLFCLVYLQLTRPRFSRDDFNKFVYSRQQDLLSRPQTVEDTLADWMQRMHYVDSPRLWKQDSAYYGSMDFDRMQAIYRAAFGNPHHFTFFLVGDLPPRQARLLTEKYLASLPVSPQELRPAPDDLQRRGSFRETLIAGIPDDKYLINVEFTNRLRLSPKEEITFSLLQLVLQDRYHYAIREAAGGSYSIAVQATPGATEQFLAVRFESSLEKGDRMRDEVHRQIRLLTEKGVGDEELGDQVLALKKKLEQRTFVPTNATLVNEMKQFLDTGKWTESNAALEKRIDRIRPADLRRLARKFFASAECKDLGVKARNSAIQALQENIRKYE